MEEQERRIELEVEVDGTPEEVWAAIATGPGISSWYVPHVVEERQNGSASASFGPGPEMQIAGRVAAWEPPRRIVFDNGEGAGGMAFEWLVEARDGGSCVVRLVNTGFGSGTEWDGEYDGMSEGWKLFLLNLQLHLRYFRGQHGTAMLPMAAWALTSDEAWTKLLASLGVPETVAAGDRFVVAGDGAPHLAGTVHEVGPRRLAVVLDEPCRGTAFVASEGAGDSAGVSVWAYLYGNDAPEVVRRDDPVWRAWLERLVPSA